MIVSPDSKNARRFRSFLLSAFRAEPLLYQFVIRSRRHQRIVGRAGVCGPWNESEKKEPITRREKAKRFISCTKGNYRRSNPRSATSKVSPEPETGSGRASPYRAWYENFAEPILRRACAVIRSDWRSTFPASRYRPRICEFLQPSYRPPWDLH
jgi:hypothetical protein